MVNFNIEYHNSDSVYQKAIAFSSNYFHLGVKEKVCVLNDANEAILIKKSFSFMVSALKVASYFTVILPLLAAIPLLSLSAQQYFNKEQRFKVASDLQDLSQEAQNIAKEILYAENGDRKVWENFGGEPEAVKEHPNSVNFIKHSKILFSIAAFGNGHEIQYDTDHQPKILCNGVFTRVDDLLKDFGFTFDKFGLLRDKEDREWNYTFGKGLQQVDWKFDKEVPSYRLSSNEMKELAAIGAEFDAEKHPVTEESCFVQVLTADHGVVPETGLFRNLASQVPGHAAVRFIKADGTVYSTGLESLFIRSELFGNPKQFLHTIPAGISKVDYEELRPFHKKYVTTIPIKSEDFEAIIDELDLLSKSDVMTFNFGRMNCTAFAQFALNRIGVELETRTIIRSIFWNMLPDSSMLAKLNNRFGVEMNHSFGNWIIQKICRSLGANKVSDLVDQSKKPPAVHPIWSRFWSFYSQETWGGLKDDENRGYFNPEIVTWQKKQGSTRVFQYQPNKPQFNILGGVKC